MRISAQFALVVACLALDCAVGDQPDTSSASAESLQAGDNAAQQTEADFSFVVDPLTFKGPFEKTAEPLSRIAILKRKGRQLVAALPDGRQETYPIINEIRQAGGGGSGSGSGNDNYWIQTMYGYEISGVFSNGRIDRNQDDKSDQTDSFCIELEELVDCGRSLCFFGNSDTDLHIVLHGGSQPYLFHLQQNKRGNICVQEIRGTEVFYASAVDFDSFCERNARFTSERLIPLLTKSGIRLPVTRYHAAAIEQVITLIGSVDRKLEQQFQSRFADLDAKEFEQRELASKQLEKEHEQWKDIIRRAITDEHYSFETRERLSSLTKSKSTELEIEMMSLIAGSKLTESIPYLIWLFEFANKDQHVEIASRLKTLTGEGQIAPEQQAWQEWLESQLISSGSTQQETNFESQSLIESQGTIQQMTESVSGLVQLCLVDERLQLDREAWKRPFKGKTVVELVQETKDDIEAKGLPADWFTSKVSTGDPAIDAAQVLFLKMKAAVPPSESQSHHQISNRFSYHSSPWHKDFALPNLAGSLGFRKLLTREQRREKKDKEIKQVRFQIAEHQTGHQVLQVYETEEHSILIQVVSPISGCMFQFFQTDAGEITVGIVEGDQAGSWSSNSFNEFRTEHESVFTERLKPVFQRFGIQLAENADGPLKIENQQ